MWKTAACRWKPGKLVVSGKTEPEESIKGTYYCATSYFIQYSHPMLECQMFELNKAKVLVIEGNLYFSLSSGSFKN